VRGKVPFFLSPESLSFFGAKDEEESRTLVNLAGSQGQAGQEGGTDCWLNAGVQQVLISLKWPILGKPLISRTPNWI
jgi:hypothetical protein